MEAVSDRQRAHDLIERLPASQVATAVLFLEFMLLDPVTRASATAPADDEPLTGPDDEPLTDVEDEPLAD